MNDLSDLRRGEAGMILAWCGVTCHWMQIRYWSNWSWNLQHQQSNNDAFYNSLVDDQTHYWAAAPCNAKLEDHDELLSRATTHINAFIFKCTVWRALNFKCTVGHCSIAQDSRIIGVFMLYVATQPYIIKRRQTLICTTIGKLIAIISWKSNIIQAINYTRSCAFNWRKFHPSSYILMLCYSRWLEMTERTQLPISVSLYVIARSMLYNFRVIWRLRISRPCNLSLEVTGHT